MDTLTHIDPYIRQALHICASTLVEDTPLNADRRTWDQHTTALSAQLYACAQAYIATQEVP